MNLLPRRPDDLHPSLAFVLGEHQAESATTHFTPADQREGMPAQRGTTSRVITVLSGFDLSTPVDMNGLNRTVFSWPTLDKDVINVRAVTSTQGAQHHRIIKVNHRIPPSQCRQPLSRRGTDDHTRRSSSK